MAELRLEELSAKTIVAANGLTLRRGQEQFVTPPSYAIADSFINPVTSWPRVVLDGDRVVGFIRGNFDPDATQEEFRSCVWRVTVAADVQGMGVGRFAVLALAEEASSRGFDTLTAIWEPGDDGPEDFFLKIGFTIVGQTQYGENLGALTLAGDG
ncbi:GNAT family N-acetyltransferase [soil metagenome]